MSTPSYSNIEMWLFELAEGNLSPDQIAKLDLFLLQNPELDIDRDMWELAKVNPENHIYKEKEKLFKRKPIGLYGLVGSLVLLLFIFVGYSSFYYLSNKNLADDTLETRVSDLQLENKMLKQEIANLKRRTAPTSIENESSEEFVPEEKVVSIKSNISQLSDGASLTELVSKEFEKNEQFELSQPHPDLTSLDQSSTILFKELNPILMVGAAEKPDNMNGVLSKGSKTQHVDYDMSFRNRLFKFGRVLQKMIDNPIALKNSRDPQYHVPGMISRDINFGATGTMSAPRVEMFSRVQWYGQENELIQNQLAIDGYSYGVRGGIGVQMKHAYYNDGGIQISNAALTYSPKLSVNRFFSIEPALRFKMGNKLLSDSKMEDVSNVEIDRGIVHQYYEQGAQPIGSNLWYKDIGLGLNVNTKWFFVSAQLDNVLNHKDNIYTSDLLNPRRAGTHFVTSIGTDYESKQTYKSGHSEYGFSTYLMYQKHEQLSEMWLGLNARWRWLTFGGALSSGLDPVASLGVKFNYFLLQYNADYSSSAMNNKRELSHQLTLRFLGKPSYLKKR